MIAALSLMVSAATASAECAWVLWTKVGGTAGDTSGWLPQETFESRKPCVEKITRIRQQFDAARLSTGYILEYETSIATFVTEPGADDSSRR